MAKTADVGTIEGTMKIVARAGEKTAKAGVETPDTLGAALTARWKECEDANWLQDVDTNPILVEYNTTRKALTFNAPVVVRDQNLQCGGSIRQTVSGTFA